MEEENEKEVNEMAKKIAKQLIENENEVDPDITKIIEDEFN